jgi:hypothetical protein
MKKPKSKLLLISITSTDAYAKGLQILTRSYILKFYIIKRITFEDLTDEISKSLSKHKTSIELTRCSDYDKIHVRCRPAILE